MPYESLIEEGNRFDQNERAVLISSFRPKPAFSAKRSSKRSRLIMNNQAEVSAKLLSHDQRTAGDRRAASYRLTVMVVSNLLLGLVVHSKTMKAPMPKRTKLSMCGRDLCSRNSRSLSQVLRPWCQPWLSNDDKAHAVIVIPEISKPDWIKATSIYPLTSP